MKRGVLLSYVGKPRGLRELLAASVAIEARDPGFFRRRDRVRIRPIVPREPGPKS